MSVTTILDQATKAPHGAAGRSRPAGRALALLLPLVLFVVLPFAETAQARNAPDSFAELAERLLPSVVNISTSQAMAARRGGRESPFEEYFREFFERQQREGRPQPRATSLGSGFVLDPAGLIATNHHVVSEADEITVILHDGTRLKAEVIGRDPQTDLALLKVEPTQPLAAVAFGDSERTRVGDWVLAIGNPFGLGGTVTAGIVSARSRDINAGPYDDFLQTDASINRGNSGGPMFNLAGQVIGINTAIYSPSGGSVGIGFAIPSNLARPVLDQLREFGRTRRGWLGVRIQTVTEELAQGLGLDGVRGALIAAVTRDGPAAQAAMQDGDVVLRFDGKEVDDMRRLPRLVAETPVGKEVPVEVWRQGRRVTLAVTVGEFPEQEATVAARTPGPGTSQPTSVESLGLELAPLTPDLRQRFAIAPDIEGVVVTGVRDNSPAAQRRLKPGDVIRRVGPEQTAVSDPEDIRRTVERARAARLKTVLLLVESEGSQRFVALGIEAERG